MAKVKIISDPYHKKIGYFKFNEEIGEWDDFYGKNDNSSNGIFLDKKYTEEFFQFKIRLKESKNAMISLLIKFQVRVKK